MKKSILIIIFFALLVASISSSESNFVNVDERVEDALETDDEVSVIVMLKDDYSPVKKMGVSSVDSKNLKTKKQMIKKQQEKVFSELNIKKDSSKALNQIENNETKPEFKIKHQYKTINGFSGKITIEGLEKLKNNPDVKGIYLNGVKHITLDESVLLINATKTWSVIYNGTNITGMGETVCVLDTGVDYTHDNLGNCTNETFLAGNCSKVIAGYDHVNDDSNPMDDHGHGTHVAGIVASNHSTYKGVAPDAKIVAIKVCNAGGGCLDSDTISGIDWCTNNASKYNISVISISLGGDINYSDYCDVNASEAAFIAPINGAVGQNVSVVIAAGNYGHNNLINSPACIQNATPIGATNDNDAIASFSNRNSLVELMAPGSSITSLAVGGGTTSMSGTSMSTPHAAAAFALINQYRRLEGSARLTPAEIEDALNDTGKAISDGADTYRRINIYAAILLLNKAPLIEFVAPTKTNNSVTSKNYTEINISITELDLKELIYNWNGTNYTMYNDSLVLMFNFDNVSALNENDSNVFDVSGNGNNGTVYGNGAKFNLTGGRFGGGIVFDGSESNNMTINYTAVNGLDYGSISMWFKFVEMPANGEVMLPILYFGNSTTNSSGLIIEIGHFSGFEYNGTQIFYTVTANNRGDNTTPNFCFDSRINLTNNTWYNFVVTVNSTGNTAYLNGAEMTDRHYNFGSATDSIFFSNITNANLFTIGYGKFASEVQSKHWHEFNGTIDELRIWNTSLKANEVYQQYIANLNKYNANKWSLYINQSLNTSDGLPDGSYTYQAFAKDNLDKENTTGQRVLNIDLTSPGIDFAGGTKANNSYNESNWIYINVTVTEPNFNNITFLLYNSSSVVNETNFTSAVYSINFTNLDDGSYYYNVTARDEAGKSNSTETRKITIDTIIPATNVSLTSVDDYDNDGNIELNWTDDLAELYSKNLTITYRILRSTAKINSSNVGSSVLISNATTNTTQFFEDNSTVHGTTYFYAIITIDSFGRFNDSVVSSSLNATANDTIAPKIPLNVNVTKSGATATIKWQNITRDINNNPDFYSLTAEIWYGTSVNTSKTFVNETNSGFSWLKNLTNNENSTTWSTTTEGTTLYHFAVVTTDDAGNRNFTLNTASDGNYGNTSLTYTAPTTSSGGGGGGGGSGGGGGGVAVSSGVSVSQFWSVLTKGESTMKISKPTIAISEIKLNMKNQVINAEVTVKKLEEKPDDVKEKPIDNLYQYIEIEKKEIQNADIQNAKIKFKVTKSWLKVKNIDEKSVALRKYTTRWVGLQTKKLSSDTSYVTYEATTSGFSYFAITGKETEKNITTLTKTAKNKTKEEIPENKTEVKKEIDGKKKLNLKVPVIILIILVIALVFLIVKSRLISELWAKRHRKKARKQHYKARKHHKKGAHHKARKHHVNAAIHHKKAIKHHLKNNKAHNIEKARQHQKAMDKHIEAIRHIDAKNFSKIEKIDNELEDIDKKIGE